MSATWIALTSRQRLLSIERLSLPPGQQIVGGHAEVGRETGSLFIADAPARGGVEAARSLHRGGQRTINVLGRLELVEADIAREVRNVFAPFGRRCHRSGAGVGRGPAAEGQHIVRCNTLSRLQALCVGHYVRQPTCLPSCFDAVASELRADKLSTLHIGVHRHRGRVGLG
ncbi:hypothetical protein [Sphingomonas sp. CCH5-D11]|uniref:hypothetical protein n=1 Tax=Sphingomonas sp. CCH5-D11 TaxID=1768786 RepID=UPI00083611B6|nr:hypothetical protein [Sphingomonas sp. CCH5-D11]